MRFTYTAEKPGGEIYKGVADAADRFEVYGMIRQEGSRMLSIEEDDPSNFLTLAYWNTKLSHVSEYEKILFARNLGAMVSAGLSLARALTIMQRQTTNLRMSGVISQVVTGVRHGSFLNVALGEHPRVFSNLFIAMVRAGEEGGSLPSSLQLVSDQMERMYLIKRKVRGALIYPCIILIAIVGIGFLMMTQVVPTLAQTFAGMNASLPLSTRFVIGASDFLVQYTALSLGSVIGGIALIYLALRTRVGKRSTDFAVLRIPVISGIVREVNAARTARTLSSLLTSGVDVTRALEIVGGVVQNSFFQEVVADASRAVGQGEPLSAAFIRREDLYPAFVGEMMAVGEETGQIADMLKRLAIYYEDEVDRSTKALSAIIEPLLMLLVGSAVGFFAVSMITPIYQISQNIS